MTQGAKSFAWWSLMYELTAHNNVLNTGFPSRCSVYKDSSASNVKRAGNQQKKYKQLV